MTKRTADDYARRIFEQMTERYDATFILAVVESLASQRSSTRTHDDAFQGVRLLCEEWGYDVNAVLRDLVPHDWKSVEG
jgi:hypothetical protein